MHNSPSVAAACLAALTLAAGCSDEYGHERLGAESPEFIAVAAMLDELRGAGADGLDDVLTRQIVTGLTPPREKHLRWALTQLAQADEAAVVRVDRWGGDLYRATITYTDTDGDHTTALILIPDGDETFYWVKTN